MTVPRGIGPAVALILTMGPGLGRGQDAGLGATAQGGAIRGQGQFLRGMAWYEAGSAEAMSVGVDAEIAWNRAVRANYDQYLRDRAQRSAAKAAVRDARQADLAKLAAEAQRRWRANPTDDDIRSGEALNALASDLADPSIPVSSWRSALVALPDDVSLTGLAFRPSGPANERLQIRSGPVVVAIDRMKAGAPWPAELAGPDWGPERMAYRRAVDAVFEACRGDRPLQARDVEGLRDAVQSLKAKAAVLPRRGEARARGEAFVRRLDEATRLLVFQDMAEELIRDLDRHKAATVAELLAFMRKFRLIFAEADDSPGALAAYRSLYQQLRAQKTALGAPVAP
jgi:hypothetical protein